MTAPFPLLSCALWAVSVAVWARCTCLLAVLALGKGGEGTRRLVAWQCAGYALASGAAVSAGDWLPGLVLAVVAAGLAVLWRRASL